MKVNEAPEKLYLHPTAKGKIGASWLTFPLTNGDIEYVRTDAFIEKVCEWIGNNANNYWCTEFVDSGEMVEDFKNYLKGE